MIPTWWQAALLTLATARLWRLLAVDDMPWLVRARNRLVGAVEINSTWDFARPTLAQMIQCGWCLGFWCSLTVTACWWLTPHRTLVAAVPFAVSTGVGLLARLMVW